MPVLPHPRSQFGADPALISDLIAESGYNLLLDLAHARVAAAGLHMDIRSYLRALPLERVVALHVSGPRQFNDRLYDAHEPLADVDYEILRWTLSHTQPRLITLEYYRDPQNLRQQILGLNHLIHAL